MYILFTFGYCHKIHTLIKLLILKCFYLNMTIHILNLYKQITVTINIPRYVL